MQSCLVNGVLDEGRCHRVVDEVLAEKPRGYLGVLSHYERLVRLELARRTAVVESAVALPPAQQQQIQGRLTARYGAGLRFEFLVNAALVGGVRIRVGSDVLDGSIAGRLRELEGSFESA